MPEPGQHIEESEIYVGYLPVPRAYKRFLRVLVPCALWGLVIVAWFVARTQPDPGPAIWDQSTLRRFTGTILATPYPAMYADDRGDGLPGLLFLVEAGKHGGKRAAAFDGRRVTVSGWVLQRGGGMMLEMEPGDGAIASEAGPVLDLPSARPLGRVTLRGQIVDSKCFLGAMKPGEGKTHKECATLCIAGGIPPMLVTRDAGGAVTCYLLMDPAGGALSEASYPFIADPVEITGELESVGGLLRLRVARGDVRRL